MDGYIKKSEAVDVIVKYPYEIAGKTATAIKMIEDLPSADVVPKSEYDAVVSAVDNSTKEFLKLHDDYQKLLERNAKLHSQMAKYKLDLQNSKSEVEKWIDRCRDWHEVGELKCQEIERLHGILLQFTDIVHKWGAKNNIDTSEISLVPILQEEADSIIKKANQELASEIFEKIEKIILDNTIPILTENISL